MAPSSTGQKEELRPEAIQLLGGQVTVERSVRGRLLLGGLASAIALPIIVAGVSIARGASQRETASQSGELAAVSRLVARLSVGRDTAFNAQAFFFAGSDPEDQFYREANCDSATPGIVRGLLKGRFDEAGHEPEDRVLPKAFMLLRVTDSRDPDRVIHRDFQTTKEKGEFAFHKVPRSGGYDLWAVHPLIRGFEERYSYGDVRRIQEKCVLPRTMNHKLVSLSRQNEEILRQQGSEW